MTAAKLKSKEVLIVWINGEIVGATKTPTFDTILEMASEHIGEPVSMVSHPGKPIDAPLSDSQTGSITVRVHPDGDDDGYEETVEYFTVAFY